MNLFRGYFLLIFLSYISLISLSYAQTATNSQDNFKSYLSQISAIDQQITAQNNTYSMLKKFQKQLDIIHKKSHICIDEENKKNDKIEKILTYFSQESKVNDNDYKTLLTQKKDVIKKKIAECSFIAYRTEEISDTINLKITTLEEPTSWKRTNPIWEVIKNASFSTAAENFLSEQNIALYKNILFVCIIIMLYYLTNHILSLNYIKNKYSFFTKKTLKIIFLNLYFIVLILFLFGYHNYALLIIPKVILSSFVIIILYQLIRIISKLQHTFDLNESDFTKKIHDRFGLDSNKTMPELIVLRSLIYTSIISWSIMLLLHIWGLPEAYQDQIINTAFNGVTIFDITIFPVRILRAIFIFFIFILLGRYLAHSVMKSPALQKEYHLQVTISTLIRYATFIVASALSLYIAGINFAGVAIALGALLVGVGFGLQQIVSDFIAGLILLSNNVVRPADFIAIDNIEGTIKKIRLLSTEIQSDDCIVLIPNSFLISRSVNNYTDKEQTYYANTQVLIEHLSELKRIEKIMLIAAMGNAHIINNELHKPYTEIEFFNNRGVMGVCIVMYFPIASASQRDEIRTQLNRDILDILREEKISILI